MLGGGLLLASELQEVVVLRTVAHGGSDETVRLWIVDHAGRPWLRCGDAGRPWLQRVRSHPEVRMLRNGEERPYRATLMTREGAVQNIDRLMREKYGWTDAIIRLLEGSPSSVPIRLDPLEAGS
jgi:hypothetical protein